MDLNNEQKVKSFWLKSDYVSYNSTPGIPSRIKLPKGEVEILIKKWQATKLKCDILDIQSNCLKVSAGLFAGVFFSGDALITMSTMDYDLTDKATLKKVKADKKTIQKKYQELRTSNPELFDSTELKEKIDKEKGIDRAKMEQEREQKKLEREQKIQDEKHSNDKKLFGKLNRLKEQINDLAAIGVNEVVEFKKLVLEKEQEIVENGGDEKLFEFLKLDAFLNDFRNQIINDQESIVASDFSKLEERIELEERYKTDSFNELDIATWGFGSPDGKPNRTLARLNYGHNNIELFASNKSLDSRLETLYTAGDLLRPSFEASIRNLNIYQSFAISSLVYYLNNNRIQYFEVYTAFEKMGVFDSSWQKSVKGTLKSIDAKLSSINSQLITLNSELANLAAANQNLGESIRTGLDALQSSVDTNTIVSGITAYQTWKLNKNK